MRRELLDQLDNAPNGRGENNEVTFGARFERVRNGDINSPPPLRFFEYETPITSDDLAAKPAFFQGKSERSTDQAGTDDRDLAKWRGSSH